ncbi:hypothetical protein [Ktedonobacter robiniae]|uniref:Uncharacterized protein n=1 Tax=Ktedonobacter robiniae TaxID=2778365 RepID=A0ABQ3V2U8_9CHLR|nr:hypothetical protein [Ktedonobacter robiniae]GHO59281.1 hypothetical protein KSB_77560 [Ktedonobacter robiniae]
MAKNRLQEHDNNLPPVEYEVLLKGILAVLKSWMPPFLTTASTLSLPIDKIAQEVVSNLQRTNFTDVRPFVPSRQLTHVAAHFLDGEAFNEFRLLIEQIRDQLVHHLTSTLTSAYPGKTLETYVQELLNSPADLSGETFSDQTFSALTYSFDKTIKLKKRRLHLQARHKPGQSGTRFLGHKLTITVRDMKLFEQQLINALCNQLEVADQPPSTLEIERIRTVLHQRLQDEGSELGILKRILQKEAFGRLQKEAKIRYLEYIARAMGKSKSFNGDRTLLLLKNLAQRLRFLEDFLRQDKPDSYYQVSYSGCGANYCTLFSRAEVYDLLPIFSDIEGTLGTTFNKDKGEQEFILGVKLKLNGRFRTYTSVFHYYLTLLDPASEEHKERKKGSNFHRQAFLEKVLKLALLYYFVFKNMDDPTYNPAQDVEQELLVDLRRTDDQADFRKQQRLNWLVRGLKAEQHFSNLDLLRNDLKEFVKNASSEFELWPKTCYLSVSADIIDPDEERMRNEKKFFRSEAFLERGMNVLKYVTIEGASAAGNSLCSLPVSIGFEPMYYYNTPQEAEQQFSMAYNTRFFAFLPIVYIPNAGPGFTLCQSTYKSYKHLEIPYAPSLPYANTPTAVFVYHFTYLLLNYLCLKLLSTIAQEHIAPKRRLFVPLLRIHQAAKATEKEEKHGEEEFLRAHSKALAHILSEQDVLANAQGLHIGVLQHLSQKNDQKKVKESQHKLKNALSSLYSILPKVFTLDTQPELDNLAVIVVSSRKCDAHRDSKLHLSNIYGEVIGIRRYQESNRVQIVPLNTFSANEDSDNLYRLPTVLQDQAKKCYLRGYKHILYVAQAPYSSSLHLSSAETAEEQFFMSGSIIQSLKHGQSDLHIYPVYCDKFYVVKNMGTIIESLYVDDTRELRSLVNDPNRSSIVFFNLLNGLIVGKDQTQRFYNGVVSYATLINVYDDPIYDQDIRNNLLDGTQPGSLKKSLLDFLTLLHFARYEREANTISFKLDPYENIIGSDSVGTLSLIDHMEANVRFNMLAFLTEVRSVMNRYYTGYVSTLFSDDQETPEQDGSSEG